uniref:Uncharacterized protein n=1 Tax=Populus trichocarpa TaxID=3694 RepID=A9PDP1_POPTR|nr:unknown [Populus trichocarpa]
MPMRSAIPIRSARASPLLRLRVRGAIGTGAPAMISQPSPRAHPGNASVAGIRRVLPLPLLQAQPQMLLRLLGRRRHLKPVQPLHRS